MGRKWILPGKVLVPARKKVVVGEQWKVNWREGDPEIWSYNSSSSLSSEATGDDGLKNGGVCVVIDWHDWLSAARNAVPNAMAIRWQRICQLITFKQVTHALTYHLYSYAPSRRYARHDPAPEAAGWLVRLSLLLSNKCDFERPKRIHGW